VARSGHRDLVQLLIGHESGARSSYALSIDTPQPAALNSLVVWGSEGSFDLPPGPADPAAALATAAGELAESAAQSSPSHPLDVHFGRRVVELLADAESQLAR
jgi:hypothetical protein